MLDLRCFEQTAQVGRDVADVMAETDRVSEHVAGALIVAADLFEGRFDRKLQGLLLGLALGAGLLSRGRSGGGPHRAGPAL
jgi:hypothetical protein